MNRIIEVHDGVNVMEEEAVNGLSDVFTNQTIEILIDAFKRDIKQHVENRSNRISPFMVQFEDSFSSR